MLKCKHEYKSKVDLVIEEHTRLKDTVLLVGRFDVYRCLECKCLVWEERSANG